MIFTLGKTDVYDPLLRDHPDATKEGRSDDYAGGSVWETFEAAQAYLDSTILGEEFSIYGVLADWETQTEPEPGQGWHRLLVTSKLIKLEQHDG